MSEFTGERVIPGLVDPNLLNEHVARYRFATQFTTGETLVLDAGCGSGYGAAHLAETARVIAIDVSSDALTHARENFAKPRLSFTRATCESLPFADASFDLVITFEVIEHLKRWPELLREALRVLKPSGILLVSTPNKAYYAESRAEAGPNPFHCHEFEYEEFEAALYAVFPHVRMWTQNHAEAIAFAPANPAGTVLDANGDAAPGHAHFFLAACSQSEIAQNNVVAWLPSTANLLREREHHIAKLEGELAKKDVWLKQLAADHSSLQREHEATLTELRGRNKWAEDLNAELSKSRAIITALHEEAETRLKWIRENEARAKADADERLSWISQLESRIAELSAEILQGIAEIARLNAHREALERDLAARAAWGESLNARIDEYTAEIDRVRNELNATNDAVTRLTEERALIAASRWMRLGRKLNIGPAVDPR